MGLQTTGKGDGRVLSVNTQLKSRSHTNYCYFTGSLQSNTTKINYDANVESL